ncbi:NepR family anti-sigma factor [Hyphomonas pacifica]|uniref:NepR family anti-sigma factor n=1 Tax=Hyphomonas pacifica TaxID=1280941 RepID=UPI000AFC26E1|nr:NepR family anti-sigma factor [Hyphomonas pacifica]
MKKDARNTAKPTSSAYPPARYTDNRHESLEKGLKDVYNETLKQPIPDKLLRLMQQLKEAEDLKTRK